MRPTHQAGKHSRPARPTLSAGRGQGRGAPARGAARRLRSGPPGAAGAGEAHVGERWVSTRQLARPQKGSPVKCERPSSWRDGGGPGARTQQPPTRELSSPPARPRHHEGVLVCLPHCPTQGGREASSCLCSASRLSSLGPAVGLGAPSPPAAPAALTAPAAAPGPNTSPLSNTQRRGFSTFLRCKLSFPIPRRAQRQKGKAPWHQQLFPGTLAARSPAWAERPTDPHSPLTTHTKTA